MSLKVETIERKSVKHLMLAGPGEELDKTINDFLNDGWDIKEARLVNHDSYNKITTVFYVLVKTVIS